MGPFGWIAQLENQRLREISTLVKDDLQGKPNGLLMFDIASHKHDLLCPSGRHHAEHSVANQAPQPNPDDTNGMADELFHVVFLMLNDRWVYPIELHQLEKQDRQS